MFQLKPISNDAKPQQSLNIWLLLTMLVMALFTTTLQAEAEMQDHEHQTESHQHDEAEHSDDETSAEATQKSHQHDENAPHNSDDPAHKQDEESHEDHQEDGHDELTKGPHGGRLLSKDNGLSIELTIDEDNMQPKFRVWLRNKEGALVKTANKAELLVTLTRLGGEEQLIKFIPVEGEDYWQSSVIIEEPHSFDVMVNLNYQGNTVEWHYASYEGRMQMDAETAQRQSVKTRTVSAGQIAVTTRVYGNVVVSPDRISQVKARFPGQITSVKVAYGDRVKDGQVLATVESNSSLQTYSVRAPISGVITAKYASSGEVAADQALFTITDTSTLWAELKVFPKQAQSIATGQTVRLGGADSTVQSSIQQLLPNTQQAPYLIARVPLKDTEQTWFPGMMVEADVTIQQKDADIRVPNSAIQRLNDNQIVFIKVGDQYELRPLEVGLSDKNYTEVKSGLRQGDEIVVGNSYLIKADLEKSGAAHAH